ncbi:MAG: nuclear transport factor 2 family protein [Albidovulum sp.]|nr:nuclear transport factor 2 family protein [Albidovulum sp.]MDE0307710.1 nuclear transport factor 2 family protein [Albidovulum sp.]MDE0532116.1 nuclear transport factor 2 family protein [Albidovulum sp.]
MTNFQEIKKLVQNYYAELDAAAPDELADTIQSYATGDYFWRGMHPFNELSDPREVGNLFWRPFRQAFSSIQRRPDVFMAGNNVIDDVGGEWVCCMGHLLGLFDENWLGIPSTGKMAFLRFVEFHQVKSGKIAQTALFCDIPSVMRQAGVNPFPVETGAWFLTPGPKTHDGLLYGFQNPDDTGKTMDLIHRMINDLTSSGMESPQGELAETWHDDMIWFGPTGIGAAYTIKRYQEQHQGPFRAGLQNIVFNGHVCRFSEGVYGGFFGWPNLTMLPSGGFMGFPATGKTADMRVVDIYRREGDFLAENWIFIDLLYFYFQQGVDILARLKKINRT